MYLDAKHKAFRKEVGQLALATRPRPRVKGEFVAEIALNSRRVWGDVDNRIKSLLDALQRAGVIENDRHCRKLTIEWTGPEQAPMGCRVVLSPCPPRLP